MTATPFWQAISTHATPVGTLRTQQMTQETACNQLFSLFGLEQLNHFATNIYADQLKSCLDLISTDIPSVHTRSTEPLGKSDHVAIVGYIQTSHGSDAPDSRQIWCWSKANANDLRDEVNSRNWTDVLDAEDVTIADLEGTSPGNREAAHPKTFRQGLFTPSSLDEPNTPAGGP